MKGRTTYRGYPVWKGGEVLDLNSNDNADWPKLGKHGQSELDIMDEVEEGMKEQREENGD